MKQLNNDPEYIAQEAKAEAERQALREALIRAERPLVDELAAAGVHVGSVWDLYKFPETGETVYPILVRHLRRQYPDRILNGIGRAFPKDVARRYWPELLSLYVTETRAEVLDGLAATLSACATKTHYDDLLAILENEALGESRAYFLRPVNRIGNRIESGTGRAVVERFANDPVLGIESRRILRGKGRND